MPRPSYRVAAGVLVAAALLTLAPATVRSQGDNPLPAPSLSFNLQRFSIPGYARFGSSVLLGGVRPPAQDARVLIYRSTRKLADGKPEPRSFQICLVSATSAEKAWTALRHPNNGPFSIHEPLPGLVYGLLPDAARVAHGPLFPPSMYTVAGVKGGFGASVTQIAGPALLKEPLTDEQIAATETVLHNLLAWQEAGWDDRRAPKFVLPPLPQPIRLRDDAGKEYSGFRAARDTYVTLASVAEAIGAQHKWSPFKETIDVTAGTRRLTLQLNSRDVKGTDGAITLHRPVRWHAGTYCISDVDVQRLFGRQPVQTGASPR